MTFVYLSDDLYYRIKSDPQFQEKLCRENICTMDDILSNHKQNLERFLSNEKSDDELRTLTNIIDQLGMEFASGFIYDKNGNNTENDDFYSNITSNKSIPENSKIVLNETSDGFYIQSDHQLKIFPDLIIAYN